MHAAPLWDIHPTPSDAPAIDAVTASDDPLIALPLKLAGIDPSPVRASARAVSMATPVSAQSA